MSGPVSAALLGAALPIHDWQFWIASLFALVALYVVLNMLGVVALVRRLIGKPAKPKGRRVQLTTSAKAASANVSGAKSSPTKTPEA